MKRFFTLYLRGFLFIVQFLLPLMLAFVPLGLYYYYHDPIYLLLYPFVVPAIYAILSMSVWWL